MNSSKKLNTIVSMDPPTETVNEGIIDLTQYSNFPFKTLIEYQKAYLCGTLDISLDRNMALQCASTKTDFLWKTWLSLLLPALASIGSIIYAIYSGQLWMLLLIPVHIIGYFTAHPTAQRGFKALNQLFDVITGLIMLSIALNYISLALGLLPLLISRETLTKLYGRAIDRTVLDSTTNDELLAMLLERHLISIQITGPQSFVAATTKLDLNKALQQAEEAIETDQHGSKATWTFIISSGLLVLAYGPLNYQWIYIVYIISAMFLASLFSIPIYYLRKELIGINSKSSLRYVFSTLDFVYNLLVSFVLFNTFKLLFEYFLQFTAFLAQK